MCSPWTPILVSTHQNWSFIVSLILEVILLHKYVTLNTILLGSVSSWNLKMNSLLFKTYLGRIFFDPGKVSKIHPCMLFNAVLVCWFSLLNNILLCEYNTIYLSICLSMDTYFQCFCCKKQLCMNIRVCVSWQELPQGLHQELIVQS